MNVKISFTLSSEGQKASILDGGDGQRYQVIHVSMDDPEFKRVLTIASITSDGTATLDTNSCQCDPIRREWDRVPTTSEIMDDLDARKAAKLAADARHAVEVHNNTLAVLRERAIRTETRRDDSENAWYPISTPKWPHERDENVVMSPEAKAWQTKLDAENEFSHKQWLIQRKAEREAKEQAEHDRKQAERDRRTRIGLQDGDDDYEFEQGCLTQVPVYETHKRGKNWMAMITVDSKCPGGLNRSFCDHAKGDSYYVLPSLKPGDAVEFGADYYSGSGKKSAERWYGYVVRIDPQDSNEPGRLILHKCSNGKTAVNEGRKHASLITV